MSLGLEEDAIQDYSQLKRRSKFLSAKLLRTDSLSY
jgi:hypothetical protein